jgi:hypothetical protein
MAPDPPELVQGRQAFGQSRNASLVTEVPEWVRVEARKYYLSRSLDGFREALRQYPNHPDVHLELGRAQLHLAGNTHDLIATRLRQLKKGTRFKAGIEPAPTEVRKHATRIPEERLREIKRRLDDGQHDAAIMELNSLLGAAPYNPKLHEMLAKALTDLSIHGTTRPR